MPIAYRTSLLHEVAPSLTATGIRNAMDCWLMQPYGEPNDWPFTCVGRAYRAPPFRIMIIASSGNPIRAAQYLRMSSDVQRYSTENQQNAIAEYAEQHGYEIVASYRDSGK